MANTYTLIASSTLSSSAASVTFSSITNTYTDLVLKASLRSTAASLVGTATVTFNGNTGSVYSYTVLRANGTTPQSVAAPANGSAYLGAIPAASSTSNVFSYSELYIPSYTSSTSKPFSAESIQEDNGINFYSGVAANLFIPTSAITSITIGLGGNSFASGSSFFLYGIKNS